MSLIDVQRGNTTKETIGFTLETCCNCGIPFLMPSYHQKRLVETQEWFYCPNGHQQHYCGLTEAQKAKQQLERERSEHERRVAFLQDRLLDNINDKKKVERELKRLKKGVCPCCNRTFQNLHNHMKNQHPDYTNK